ncbi:MAG: DUF4350 domain-containing protein [bacterium]
MTETSHPPVRSREWWTRPGIMLPLVVALIALVALLAPQGGGDDLGDTRLSTHRAGPSGARLLYESVERLGWRASQRDTSPAPGPATGITVHAVLAPSRRVTAGEAHAYLEAVRGGDALLLVLETRDALSDSLGVQHTTRGGQLVPIAADLEGCRRQIELVPPRWVDGRVHLWGLRWQHGPPGDRKLFGVVNFDDPAGGAGESVVGFALGKGRVVVVADPDLLRNDVVRRCAWGADVRVVRLLEWLRAGGLVARTALVVDEYHHGYGHAPTASDVVYDFLIGHPVGRTVLQIALAALVLLLAVAPRALPPVDVLRVERRHPLEQIDALAHAYEQVHATRTAAARLVHGLRSRVERGWRPERGRPDDDFLHDAELRAPALAGDVDLVRRALHETLPDRDLPELGAALRRIEQTLTPTRPG